MPLTALGVHSKMRKKGGKGDRRGEEERGGEREGKGGKGRGGEGVLETVPCGQ